MGPNWVLSGPQLGSKVFKLIFNFTQERFKFVPPGQIKTVLDSRLVD